MKEYIEQLGKDGLKGAYNALGSFALYFTVFLAAAIIVAYIIVRLKSPENITKFKTFAFGIVIGYAVTLTFCIAFFMIARLIVKDEIDYKFYLMLVFLAILITVAITSACLSIKGGKAFKIFNVVGISVAAVYGVVLLFVIPTEDGYAPLSDAGMYIFSLLFVAVIVALAFLFGKDCGSASQTKAIAFAGVSVALSFALSYIKLFSLPQGGSVTLASMLPLIIYAYCFGARKGIFAGVIYGILQILQSPQIYQPMQVLLDYPIAFGAIGLAGIVKNIKWLKTPLVKFIFGASVGLFGRYIAHFLSGYYVFSSWAMEGYTALTWSLVYNCFVLVDLAIVLAVGSVLFSSKAIVNELNAINPPLYKPESEE